MKVLIAIDGSPSSLRAAQYVFSGNEVCGKSPEVTLISVHLPIPLTRVRAAVGDEVLNQYYREECEASLAPAREAAKAAGVAVKELIRVGEPADEIAKAAKEAGAQLVVLGTHGRSALGTLVMGSTATRVVGQSPVPVLMVK